MRLCTFERAREQRIGAVIESELVDLTVAAPALPREMTALLAAGDDARRAAADAAARAVQRIALESVRLCAPILRPPKFLAIGLNYADHVAESGLEAPKFPTVFNKQSTCVVGPRDAIHMPRVSSALDYEGELGFVIGRRCRHVPRGHAHEVIAGYLIVDDEYLGWSHVARLDGTRAGANAPVATDGTARQVAFCAVFPISRAPISRAPRECRTARRSPGSRARLPLRSRCARRCPPAGAWAASSRCRHPRACQWRSRRRARA